ncbi:MAG: DtxR family transcriptional regulator [Phototrophicales bacterium]|nr:MAG: DtxR family transcriptional regulator [Phototrophicales bacterium]
MSISAVMQEYLAEAYRIASDQGEPYVSTSALAEAMGVTAPAVARMATRLRELGYIDHEPYHGMCLTKIGEREALKAIRRHRLAEVFLTKVMGFKWHEVHDEADQLGPVISEQLAKRMEEMTGFPKRCPHGEPIPTAEGDIEQLHDVSLSDITPPSELKVSRVKTHDPEKLRYLAELGLVPEAPIALLSRAPFNGPLRLRINGYEQVIGAELAEILRVTTLE